TNGSCGPLFDNLECPIDSPIPDWGSGIYPCCSNSGWCGHTEAHCSGIDYRLLYTPTANSTLIAFSKSNNNDVITTTPRHIMPSTPSIPSAINTMSTQPSSYIWPTPVDSTNSLDGTLESSSTEPTFVPYS
ncbi:unnamed protein product, partial [Owenia fusiformis]